MVTLRQRDEGLRRLKEQLERGELSPARYEQECEALIRGQELPLLKASSRKLLLRASLVVALAVAVTALQRWSAAAWSRDTQIAGTAYCAEKGRQAVANCRRTCARVDGKLWNDCVLRCTDNSADPMCR